MDPPDGAACYHPGMTRTLRALLALLLAPICADAAETVISHSHQGMERRVLLVTPDRPGPFPLIIALHGAGSNGADFRRALDLEAVALAAGYALALPDGVNRRWQYQQPLLRGPATPATMPDGSEVADIAFLEGLVARLVAEGVAEPRRTYLTGFSVGALMTASAGCAAPGLWAAIGMLNAGLTDRQVPACAEGPALPAALVTGQDDSTFPWDGFVNARGRMLAQPDSLAIFAQRNGCAPGEERLGPDGFFVTEAVDCRAGGAMLARLPNFGHAPPPGAAALLIAFFSRFRH